MTHEERRKAAYHTVARLITTFLNENRGHAFRVEMQRIAREMSVAAAVPATEDTQEKK